MSKIDVKLDDLYVHPALEARLPNAKVAWPFNQPLSVYKRTDEEVTAAGDSKHYELTDGIGRLRGAREAKVEAVPCHVVPAKFTPPPAPVPKEPSKPEDKAPPTTPEGTKSE